MHKVTYRLKLVFMNTYVHAYTYTHVTTINEKAKGGIWETSEEGKHREKWCNYIIISKITVTVPRHIVFQQLDQQNYKN